MNGKINLDHKKFLRKGLDVLFVALNPPQQSNSNGHYFSGNSSGFFKLLYRSGLITYNVDKSCADEKIFASTEYNYKNAQYGVTDLVFDMLETNSGKVKVKQYHIDNLINKIQELNPRIVCIIHAKVRDEINKSLSRPMIDYGKCGKLIDGCDSIFFQNYFPNGNNISDSTKIKIFQQMKELI